MFCGNGWLDIEGVNGMFISESKLTVYACRISINATGEGIYGWQGGVNSDFELAYHGALYIKCANTAVRFFNDFKYTTGSLLKGSLTGKELMVGDNYHLEIGEVFVTPFNRDAVTGENIKGSVSVSIVDENASTYGGVSITLSDATISNSNMGINFNDMARELTIKVLGTNSITAYTRGITGNGGSDRKPLNIVGTGRLSVNSASCISHQGNLSIKDANLELNGSSCAITLWNNKKLTVDNATIHAKSTNTAYGAFIDIGQIEYKGGCMETEPLSAVYNSSLKGIANSIYSDAQLLQEVTIQPTYGVIVCGIPITKAMGSGRIELKGDGIEGNVEYDTDLNILFMYGAKLQKNGRKKNSSTIEVMDFNSDKSVTGANHSEFSICCAKGDNYINHEVGFVSMYGIYSDNDIEIYGNGNLDINTVAGVHIGGKGRWLKLNMDNNANFVDKSFNCAVYADELTLKFGDGTATYHFMGESQYAFKGLSGLELGNYAIQAPLGATYNNSQKTIVKDGSPVQNEEVIFAKSVEDYGLKIYGKKITNLNCVDPLGTQAMSYNPSTKTISIFSSVVKNDLEAIENNDVDGLTIDFVNDDCELVGRGGISTKRNCTITSSTGASANIEAVGHNYVGVYAQDASSVTIKDIFLKAKADWPISGVNNERLYIVNSNVIAESTSLENGAITDFLNIYLITCQVLKPVDARVGQSILKYDGSVAQEVVIANWSTTDIDAAKSTQDVGVLNVYDAGGRRLEGVRKGLNIIRRADGTVRKVMAK